MAYYTGNAEVHGSESRGSQLNFFRLPFASAKRSVHHHCCINPIKMFSHQVCTILEMRVRLIILLLCRKSENERKSAK